ncbi:hypothetical protein N7495_007503 [Penicillium taxi]|uniref:uncharacterized protein n=1 Tax=Penicillium taxi TaxID=168475 RepID=UPI002545AA89|nr:uncharacterized protein N7495_007503 [Penicillium taxi]KAJ5887462.1 hypothetical protein N7495_007503 [Penicillium taxi]
MSARNRRRCTSKAIFSQIYLGTSSDWSFTLRVLSLTHEHVYQEPLPTEALLFDGATYDLEWDGQPSLHSTDTVKFRCGQLYHLFDDDECVHNVNELYSQLRPNPTSGLWYIHFLMMAFGKGFVQQKPRGKNSRAAYFVKAVQLLPNKIFLYQEPIESTEILCCISLCLQALNYRSPAHNYVRCHAYLRDPLVYLLLTR